MAFLDLWHLVECASQSPDKYWDIPTRITMTLLALGINHKTAPVALRERVAFLPDTLDQALNSLLSQPMVQSGVVLSTCNRTELYLSVEQQTDLQERLVRWLCEYHDLREEDVRASLYWHQDNAAVSHLMRVASGLDSLVLGEPQILGQVKKAHADSSRDHALSSELERMFQKTFSVAKRVRTETEIGASAVSVAFAACSLARQIFNHSVRSTCCWWAPGKLSN